MIIDQVLAALADKRNKGRQKKRNKGQIYLLRLLTNSGEKTRGQTSSAEDCEMPVDLRKQTRFPPEIVDERL